jgi:hypothetical protein
MAKIDKKESEQTFLSEEEKTKKLATRYNVPYIASLFSLFLLIFFIGRILYLLKRRTIL